jgi:hypothetical protein
MVTEKLQEKVTKEVTGRGDKFQSFQSFQSTQSFLPPSPLKGELQAFVHVHCRFRTWDLGLGTRD